MITYSIDTRTIQPGQYYVAIRGERYDGHTFIPQALANGAAGLIVEEIPPTLSIPTNIVLKQVANTEMYLAKQAKQRLIDLQTDVIAITGSVGKTSTKNAIASVLAENFPLVTPQGNWNTLLGLSLTVLNELNHPEQKFVVEVGIYYKGEIAHLSKFIPPRIAIVTNVHPVHLERMKTIETITQAKRELVEALPPSGIACLNWDDPRVQSMANYCPGRVIFYGTQPGADIGPDSITADIPLLGSHTIYTALAVFCVGQALDLSANAINQGLANLHPVKGRLVKLAGNNNTTLIDDTYNASPPSTLSALGVLQGEKAKRRIAFLGDMLELGSEEEAAHQQIVEAALDVADLLILVGPCLGAAAQHVKPKHPHQVFTFKNTPDVIAALKAGQVYQAQKGDCVLLKGSAGIRMEWVVEHLLAPDVDASDVLVRQEANWK